MSTLVKFHRELDENLLSKIGYSEQPLQAIYINELGEEIEMNVELEEGLESTFQLVDPRVHYDPNIHDINIRFEFDIGNPRFLFGENGLINEDGVLGIAIRWHSKDSSQQQVLPMVPLTIDDNHLSHKENFYIDKGVLRGKVTFETIIYVIIPSSEQSYLVSGTVLGILESRLLLFDGDASMFPILEINDPKKPLWWVTCDFVDPIVDPFDENHVAIVINKGHKHFRHLKIKKGIGSSPLMLEVIATGLQIIIEKSKYMGTWDDILDEKSEIGSIGEAIYYFIHTFGWDASSPENLLRTIREDLNTRF